jgi:hypothetical protein
MPPPGPPGIAGLCFFGSSATIASVVISRPAMEAASCSAVRTTLVGSMMPFDTRLPLLSAFVYYEYVRCESLRLGICQQPADIREYARSFEAKCAEAAKDALAATSTIEETDYERRGRKEQ